MKRSGWAMVLRVLNWVCLIGVPVLLYFLLRNQDWNEVWQGLKRYPATTLLVGAAIALVSYAVFSGFDLIGKAYTGHPLRRGQVMLIAFVCYAFNLNLSSWVGGIALRYRLYTRREVKAATVTRILSLGLVTNWSGYLLIAGIVFACGLPALPDSVNIGATSLRIVGGLMVLASVSWVLACRFSRKRAWKWKSHEITLPSARMALLQVASGAVNWALMGTLMWWVMPAGADFPTVLAILLISSIAGVIAHIPAGLGVLETIFITLMQGQYNKGTLLAALIAYRALYFLMPLALACVVYLYMERRAIAQVAPTTQG